MKQRFFLFVSVFALFVGVLVFSGTGSQAVAQHRPPGGDSIPVQPPSFPDDPGNQSTGVEVVCTFSKNLRCGVKCKRCGQKYYSVESKVGYASNHRGKCRFCYGENFQPLINEL